MRRKRQYVEQIILVTDEGENTRAAVRRDACKKYREDGQGRPERLLRAHAGRRRRSWRSSAARPGIWCDAFQFTGDYYALPNLVPLLSRPSKLELLMEILEYPLPQRKPA